MPKLIHVNTLPACDTCDGVARYDVKSKQGPWGYFCDPCFKVRGIGLGTGLGQELIAGAPYPNAKPVIKPTTKREIQYTLEDLHAMIDESVLDSTPCPHCHCTQRVEPDACDYTCHECGNGTVSSPLVAAGLI